MNKKKKIIDRFNNPIVILAFDSSLKLSAMYGSYNMTERVTGIPHQRLVLACNGGLVAIRKHYWRSLDKDFIIESDDLSDLNLLDFDSQMNEDRVIYCSRNMKRGDIILESKYGDRHQYTKTQKYKDWKKQYRESRKKQL